jgi:hypothetical protein
MELDAILGKGDVDAPQTVKKRFNVDNLRDCND